MPAKPGAGWKFPEGRFRFSEWQGCSEMDGRSLLAVKHLSGDLFEQRPGVLVREGKRRLCLVGWAGCLLQELPVVRFWN